MLSRFHHPGKLSQPSRHENRQVGSFGCGCQVASPGKRFLLACMIIEFHGRSLPHTSQLRLRTGGKGFQVLISDCHSLFTFKLISLISSIAKSSFAKQPSSDLNSLICLPVNWVQRKVVYPGGFLINHSCQEVRGQGAKLSPKTK